MQDLKNYTVNKSVGDLVPIEFIVENKIIPLDIQDGSLRVGISNTYNLPLIKDLMLITKKNIIPVLIKEEQINQLISENFINERMIKNGGVPQLNYHVVQKSLENVNDEKLIKEDASIIENVNKILGDAINTGISDIHFEPFEKLFQVRYRKDGKLFVEQQLPLDQKSVYISRLKIMAELDIAEKRRSQDGRIRMMGGDKTVDIRVSTMPTDFGEKVVLRILDKSAVQLDMNKLGFTQNMRDKFESTLASPNGIILVTGPTGSGKTTTLYAALNYLNKPDVNILTIEDPIEYNLEGINQAQVKTNIDFSFSQALRSFLRQDPDIIMVGEIRDSETAEIAIRSALTGHLVLSTLHTNDAASAIARLIDMGIEAFLISSSLRMVMAQRLVRCICKNCKVQYQPNERILRSIENYTDDLPELFYKGEGCQNCNQTGYSGRTAIVEMLPVSEAISELILEKANAKRINEQANKEGVLSLYKHGMVKISEGETTIEEILQQTII